MLRPLHTLFLLIAIVSAIPAAAHANHAAPETITLLKGAETVRTFAPFPTMPGKIGNVASGDLGNDDVAEIVVGAGAGLAPLVAIFRQDGSAIGSFLAYSADFLNGVNVAVCDVNGDGTNDIVTGAKFGGGPHVRIFDAMGNSIGGFFAYAEDFRGGVNVACGDIDGDGTDDIVTGAGLSGGPHVKVFNVAGDMLVDVFNGDASDHTGSYVGVEDGIILAIAMGGTETAVSAFSLDHGNLVPHALVTDATRTRLSTTTGVADGLVATMSNTADLFEDTSPRYIQVDISEQRLTAYSYGVEVNSFLISSGTYGYSTPHAKTSVLAKLPVHHYGGADYWLPNVQWNLRFRPHYYIHSAYWHNNFGHRMSHGCINTRLEDAAWVYSWAEIGTSVEIIP